MRRSLTSSCTNQCSLGPSHCGKDAGFPTALFPVLGDTSILAICPELDDFMQISEPFWNHWIAWESLGGDTSSGDISLDWTYLFSQGLANVTITVFLSLETVFSVWLLWWFSLEPRFNKTKNKKKGGTLFVYALKERGGLKENETPFSSFPGCIFLPGSRWIEQISAPFHIFGCIWRYYL